MDNLVAELRAEAKQKFQGGANELLDAAADEIEKWRGNYQVLLDDSVTLRDEIERLTAELAEWRKLKEYAKSLGQETYLELHATNVLLARRVAELNDAHTLECAERNRLRAALENIAKGRVGDQVMFRPDLYAQAQLAGTADVGK